MCDESMSGLHTCVITEFNPYIISSVQLIVNKMMLYGYGQRAIDTNNPVSLDHMYILV